ncbi:MAG: oxidoreductase [Zavarzinella sp.]|nr:oxidoreductase [Zavarzinella sp.]
MTDPLSMPWLEAAIATPLVGSLAVGRLRDPYRAGRWGVRLTGLTMAFAVVAGFAFASGAPRPTGAWDVQGRLFGARPFALDELNAPLLPVVALLYVLTAVATGRIKMRRLSVPWLLASEGLQLAAFGCTEPWVLIGLLAAGTVPPVVELVTAGRTPRVYLLHMGLFVGLLILGWSFVPRLAEGARPETSWAVVPLLLAVLLRCGVVPAHCWITDWIEHATFGRGVLFVAPLTGVYAAIRLVIPMAPDWALETIGWVSLGTAVYAAGMATIQREARRFFAFLFLSHASLVLVGLELHTGISLTGSLWLWSSVVLSLGGLGLTLRALEARVGRLPMTHHLGLYDHSPALAVCFLLTGLASVGFPGTAGYVAAEMLVGGAVEANLLVGLGVVAAAALNGIAVLRAYFLLFAGPPNGASVPLGITFRERFAVLTLTALIVGGGLVPQPGVASWHRAAERILQEREVHLTSGGAR